MLAFIAKRIVNYVILTIVATTLGYILASTTLNPAARFLGRNPAVPQGTIDASLQKLGADPGTPLIVRTWDWWVGLVTHGSLGLSTRGTEVTADIIARSGTSLRLLVIGSLLGALLGVLLGVWNAVRQYRASDQVSTYLSFAVLATPTFVIAVVLMILTTALNQGLGVQAIRFTGEYTPGVTGFFPVLGDRLVHLLLPTISLTVGAVASYSRYQRSAMLDVLSNDFIRTARSKGRTRGSAIMRHGVRVALIPMSTFFAYSFGLILTGASITELVFSWHGMGEYFITSITNNDINAASGTILFTAILVLIAGTLADLLYAALDPRVRV
ncbi:MULTISPECIES: ABC transporter permease [unclassified Curtobacterium]|uniref:ABC transporter permease n=1 Tax=unclassified Curtobacterium TaxID=257496 RepID=UPI0008DD4696|nr:MULTISPECIES: ABC transporter permease [unclassified Curtobacterium]OIH96801.1 peptide ABC transporter permease [Curtobacterium sp. MCBA15_003]OII09299.1 peptide ABC transporter permease [Curtobacterium sp. MCBA15_009]OII29136.1 peptide ABC transporter permease [Curtobacterium sp. MMLR14_006]WIE65807.1 ABC transporter permease [Curtobacterium sp. MCLR17_036]